MTPEKNAEMIFLDVFEELVTHKTSVWRLMTERNQITTRDIWEGIMERLGKKEIPGLVPSRVRVRLSNFLQKMRADCETQAKVQTKSEFNRVCRELFQVARSNSLKRLEASQREASKTHRSIAEKFGSAHGGEKGASKAKAEKRSSDKVERSGSSDARKRKRKSKGKSADPQILSSSKRIWGNENFDWSQIICPTASMEMVFLSTMLQCAQEPDFKEIVLKRKKLPADVVLGMMRKHSQLVNIFVPFLDTMAVSRRLRKFLRRISKICATPSGKEEENPPEKTGEEIKADVESIIKEDLEVAGEEAITAFRSRFGKSEAESSGQKQDFVL